MSQLKMLALSLATASSLAMLPAVGQTQEDAPAVTERQVDRSTSAAVKSRLLWNHSTSALDIEVTTLEGVVTLAGSIESAELRELAERLAADTNGVRQVDNQLQLKTVDAQLGDESIAAGVPGKMRLEALNDAWITGKIRSLLVFTEGLAGTDISVHTRDGIVELSGEVESAAAKERTAETVRSVRGVRQVSTGALKVDS